MSLSLSDFPPDFVWGTATAAYQVEGAVAEEGRGPSIWDTFVGRPGAIADGTRGDVADDHYHRFLGDIDIMAELGVDAYRFSLSWSRIQPNGVGQANIAGLDFYRRLSEALLRRGITPWVTLYHWDLPEPLEQAGGWLARDTAERFGDFAHIAASGLSGLVSNWITLNEPWCSAFLGYASGVHAPGRRTGSLASHAAHHLLLGHARGLAAVRETVPNAYAGLTLNLYSVHAATERAADIDAARRIDGLQNRLFLEPVLTGSYPSDVLEDLGESEWFNANPASDAIDIAAPLDFLGVNYYSRHTVAAGAGDDIATSYPGSGFVEFVSTGAPRTQMDWEIHPDGLLDVLRAATAYRSDLPLYITENGAAYEDVLEEDGTIVDDERLSYIREHFAVAAKAVREGIPLKGYFLWTLLDNFEWAWGHSRRFGLAYVDYVTQVRTIKKSGRWLAGFLHRG
jgi:beta-glucosidase